MNQAALGIDVSDCRFVDYNPAEEYEAIAAALLGTVEAIRKGEES